MAGTLTVHSDAPDDGSIKRYFGDFNMSAKNKVTEVLEHVGYPTKGDQTTPRTKQNKNPHTSGDAFFPSAS